MLSTTVLFVGSDEPLAKAIDELASSNDCRFESVASLEEVLERLRHGEVGVVVACLPESCAEERFVSFLHAMTASGSGIPTLAVCEKDDPLLRVTLLREGVVDCLVRPVDMRRLAFLTELLLVKRRCAPAGAPIRVFDPQERSSDMADFLVASPQMGELAEEVRAAAEMETTILLTGETGSGKTHLARLIHQMSPRRDKPFVVVQCSALSATLLQSELFGHVRGAFTGADRDRTGRFAEAKDGTILLDDIDCIPMEAQAGLLQVVEDRVYQLVGSSTSQRLRARLITATNRVLEEETAAGRFRFDLYYRLNVVCFVLPPLRGRRFAIRPLTQQFLQKSCREASREVLQLSGEAWVAMEAYEWPGNVRELRNVIERLVVLRRKPIVELEDLPELIRSCCRPSQEKPSMAANELAAARQDGELKRLTDALRHHNNNRVRAASELGVSRATVYRKLRQHGIT